MKAAPVDLSSGKLSDERFRIATPSPATPDAMAPVFAELVDHFGWDGPVGAAFPAIIQHGIAGSAANIDDSWIGVDVEQLFGEVSGREVLVLNDADAAGLAEMRYGAGAGRSGVVLMLTFGTGIGSGLFVDGRLVPNTELGHLELDGAVAEERAAASARSREDLSWADWAARVDRYLHHVVSLCSPDLIIIGGGASKKSEKWLSHLTVDTEIVTARLHNSAGIVGAALAAVDVVPGAQHA